MTMLNMTIIDSVHVCIVLYVIDSISVVRNAKFVLAGCI